MLWLILACSEPPDPCDDMCAAAAALYGGCLAEWGVEWSAAGYEDERDFTDACTTWAWEMHILEADAVERGVKGAAGATDALCEERTTLFSSADVTCTDYTGIDWNTTPWGEG